MELVTIQLYLQLLVLFHFANCQEVTSHFKRDLTRFKNHGLNSISDATQNLTQGFLTNLIGDNQPNHFLSPLGITMLYSILLNYATGQTKSQLAKGLGMKDEPKFLHRLYKQASHLTRKLHHLKKKDGMEFGLNNILALQNNFKIEPDFETWVKDIFKAEVITGDLHSQGFVDRINKMIAKNTDQKIENFLPAPFDGEIELVLINTIFFHGIWEQPFDRDNTRPGRFKNFDGTSSQVEMMHLSKTQLRYFETDEIQVTELPYTGGFSMVIAVPKDSKALNHKSSVEKLLKVSSKPRYLKDVIVHLPRFNVTSEYDLKRIFTRLGVKRLFTPEAEIDGISKGSSMYVSESKHQAVIEVNEHGSTAAAVESLGISFRSLSIPNLFQVDRPFMFLIRGTNDGIIYFAGIIRKL